MTERDFTSLIEVRGLKKIYKTGKIQTEALKGLDFNVRRGEYIGIMGKSGAGKTTLLNMLAGIDRISEGSIRIGNFEIQKMKEDARAVWRRENLGFIFQSFQLLPGLSLMDNVMLPLDFAKNYSGQKSREKAAAMLEMVGLADHMTKLPSEISGGQQQRVAIARSLINDPQILLADEPTGRLDAATSEVVFDLFDRISRNGMTLIIVTHDNTLEQRFQRVIRLKDGEIITDNGEVQP